MYEQYYGLRERPFDLTPNPRFLFLSRRHREALAHLRYGLSGRPVCGIALMAASAPCMPRPPSANLGHEAA